MAISTQVLQREEAIIEQVRQREADISALTLQREAAIATNIQERDAAIASLRAQLSNLNVWTEAETKKSVPPAALETSIAPPSSAKPWQESKTCNGAEAREMAAFAQEEYEGSALFEHAVVNTSSQLIPNFSTPGVMASNVPESPPSSPSDIASGQAAATASERPVQREEVRSQIPDQCSDADSENLETESPLVTCCGSEAKEQEEHEPCELKPLFDSESKPSHSPTLAIVRHCNKSQPINTRSCSTAMLGRNGYAENGLNKDKENIDHNVATAPQPCRGFPRVRVKVLAISRPPACPRLRKAGVSESTRLPVVKANVRFATEVAAALFKASAALTLVHDLLRY